MNISEPKVIENTNDYVVIYKPPRMHSTPNKQKKGDSLSEWYGEGEIMHRLDYETHGLVLFAKNQKSFDFFKDMQDKGEFIKEYSAVCMEKTDAPRIVMSYFRPYGPGRKQVRPETEAKKHHEIAKDKGGFYRTEIIGIRPFGSCTKGNLLYWRSFDRLGVNESEQGYIFTVRIKRGFRHQIRSHLSWIGCPILNDPIYNPLCGNNDPENFLALRAHGLFFTDPSTGEKRECRIESIMQ